MDLYNSSGIITSDGVNYSWKGDFLGFTINGIHSSTLGIVRTSDSDRYNEELVPVFSDRTTTVPGFDGTYYFGTDYTQRKFTIKFAFDHLTDKQIRRLKQIFSNKEPQDLIFDEVPYKIYSVKVDGQPQISYLGFDEDLERIYKGDGTVNFISYLPFARSRYKYLEDYEIENLPEWGGIGENLLDWKEASGIISKEAISGIYTVDTIYNNRGNFLAKIHNPGDIAVYPKIVIKVKRSGENVDHSSNLNFGIGILGQSVSSLSLDLQKFIEETSGENEDVEYIFIDNGRRLIYCFKNKNFEPIVDQGEEEPTIDELWNLVDMSKMKIINNIIVAGDFIKIPPCNFNSDNPFLNTTGNPSNQISRLLIDYNYLYY